MRCALRSLVSAIFAVVAIGPLAAADRSVTKVAAWEPARAEPVESDIASETQLRTGIRSYVTGNFKSAADQLSAALQGTLTNDQTARALLYRGLTFRKQGSPGRALTDLTRALQQANGLSDAERSAAEENRNLASQEAGLGMAEAVAAPVVPLATAEPAPKPLAPVIARKAAPAPAEGKWIEMASTTTSVAPPAPKHEPAAPVVVGKAAPAPAEGKWVETGSITTSVAPPSPKREPQPAVAGWDKKVQVSMAPLPRHRPSRMRRSLRHQSQWRPRRPAADCRPLPFQRRPHHQTSAIAPPAPVAATPPAAPPRR